ncbi:MAG: nitrous oxide reductase family maturation protein NosD [Dehalococcoidia bacterium]
MRWLAVLGGVVLLALGFAARAWGDGSSSLQERLQQARPGETIEVTPGVYFGPFVVDKPLRLVGRGWPVLDGGGRGTVLTITAPGVNVEGFVIRGSGSSLDKEDSGILVLAPEVRIRHNRLEDVLFGIYLRQAPRGQIVGNTIGGKALDVPLRGDPVRLWESHDTVIEGNTIHDGRDAVVWFSRNVVVRGNAITRMRYALHLMYASHAQVEGNTLRDSSVGAFIMYSQHVDLVGNRMIGNRGPSGYGMGFKNADAVTVKGNLLLRNRVGLYLEDTADQTTARWEGNTIAYNDIGLLLSPTAVRNTFSNNAFADNMEQVSIRGGGHARENTWAQGGRGNFWSDYAGYDANGDGVGDVPYRSRYFFEDLASQYPLLRFFLFTPSAQALEMAVRAFPFYQPVVKMEDPAPLLSPPPLAVTPGERAFPWGGVASGALALLGLTSVVGWLWLGRKPAGPLPPSYLGDGEVLLDVAGLTKRFGRFTAVDGVSFLLRRGEVLALWGPNGAGKTTIVRCILGLLHYQGRITIGRWDARRNGVQARRLIGVAPQEPAFPEHWTPSQVVRMVATLRGIPWERADALLEQVGLASHSHQPVRTLSGGMRRRLALAIALLPDPPLLILDEPTANLDAAGRREVITLLLRLKAQGRAILLTSHRGEEAMALADRVLRLERGHSLGEVPPSAISEAQAVVSLVLVVPVASQERATQALQEAGYAVYRNGAGVRVQVAPADKVRPLAVLLQAGIPVEDFEVE